MPELPQTQMEVLEPDDDNIRQSPPAFEAKPLTKLTKYQQRQILKKAGMVELDFNKLASVAEVGDFVAQLGLYKIQVGRLTAAQSDLDLILIKTVAEVRKAKKDPERMDRLLAIVSDLSSKRLDSIKLGFKAAEQVPTKPNGNAGGGLKPAFPANVAVQVNNYAANPPEVEVK